MKSIVKLLAALPLLLIWMSCEKEVNIKLPDSTTKRLVVEGGIETNQPPLIVLTNSFGFFSKIDLGTLQNSFVHGAKITVDNGTTTIQLREYTIDSGNNFTFSFYTIDTSNTSHFSFKGEVEKFYKLKIEYDHEVYEAITKIPNPKGIDSMWTEAPKQAPANNPDVVQLYIRYTDPDTFGNCVRYYTARNHENFFPGFGSVYDDEIINGTTLNVSLSAGQAPSSSFNPDSSGYFYKGDTIQLKWSGIEKPIYNFWTTYEFAIRSVGNPFSSPINVKGNISNGALGVWAGYAPLYYDYIVPR